MNMSEFDPVPEHLLHEWTTRLLSGEKGHAAHGISRAIIIDFCTRARLNKPQSNFTLNWLADVLDQILDAGKPDVRRAFSLTPRREGGAAKADEAIDIAFWIKLATQRGFTTAEAKERAAEVFHKDPKHIGRQRLRAADWAEGMNPSFDWDEYFKYKHRPLPPPVPVSKRKGTRTR